MLGAHTIVIIAKVSMADTASGNFDDDFIGGRPGYFEFHRDQRFAAARHHPANRLGTHRSVLRFGSWVGGSKLPAWRPFSSQHPQPALTDVKENPKNVF